MPQTKLIYDNKELMVDREKLAQSCDYFRCLLMGQFRESKETEIEIHLDPEDVSFEIFAAAIDFSTTGDLAQNKSACFYADLLQLAQIWLHSKMVDEVEEKLLEFVNIKHVANLHTLARLNNLAKLSEACEKFEAKMGAWAGSEPKNWPGCSFDLHKRRHHYSRCQGFIDKQTPKPEVENWDDL